MSKKSAVVLLSGGLDSVVSLASIEDRLDIALALFFNYGQRSFEREMKAVKSICKYYSVNYEVLNLDWLKKITSTSLVNLDKDLPLYDQAKLDSDISVLESSAKSVWVPNRNGVMLNIAASYADSYDLDYVVFGANKEEAVTFPDNSIKFVDSINQSFSFSTSNKVEVIAPMAFKTKEEIVEIAISLNVPLSMLWSCYSSKTYHCGECESCNRIKRAIISNNKPELWEELSQSAF